MSYARRLVAKPSSCLYLFFLMALLFAITACQQQPAEPVSATANQPLFFDLKGYMSGQVASLETEKPKVRKRVSINGKDEEQVAQHINFGEELAVFINADLNKPAWSDKYSRDSIYTEGQLQQLRYTAKEEDLKTQWMQVSFANGAVSKIELKNHASAAIVAADEAMTYTPGKGYSIVHKEIPLMGEGKNFSVEATFE